MRFRQHQEQARAATRWLLLLFALTVLFTVLGVNVALALAWRCSSAGLAGYPTGSSRPTRWSRSASCSAAPGSSRCQLRDGGEHVARMLGGREVVAPQTPAERRLRNIVDEMAIARD